MYKSLYAFVNGSLGASASKDERNIVNTKTNDFGVAVNLYPGISLQVKKSFYVDASLNNLANISYNHSTTEQKDGLGNTVSYTSSNYSVSTSLGNGSNPLQLGIRWIIPAK